MLVVPSDCPNPCSLKVVIVTEEESAEIAKIANRIIARELGEEEGAEYMRPSPELLSRTSNLPQGATTQVIAEQLARQILEILSPDWKGPFQ